MALHIILTENGEIPEWREETSISFNGGAADYWYLYEPMIKALEKETGELLDLYDDAEFFDGNLLILKRFIEQEITKLNSRAEEEWVVNTGIQFQPDHRELYETLNKRDLIEKLQKLMRMINRAVDEDEGIVSIGD